MDTIATLPTINYILVIYFIAIQLFGIKLMLKNVTKSIYRTFLVRMLGFWAIMFIAMVAIFKITGNKLDINNGILNFQIIFMGIPCFLSVVSYPAIAMNASFMKIKKWGLLTLPMLGVVALYFIWHIISGVDPFHRYLSYQDIYQNITSTSFLLRIFVLVVFIAYIILMLLSIWRIVPVYNKYINENFSDYDFNVDWVRTMIKYMALISVAYLLMISTTHLIFNTIYIISVILLFNFIIQKALSYRICEDLELVHVKWHYKLRWEKSKSEVKTEPKLKIEPINSISPMLAIDEWMEATHSFTNVDFMASDILDNFQNITQHDLTYALKERGETFQSYVRRYRIKYACELMNQHNDIDHNSPIKLFSVVGFSHYSSFSRAF